MGTTLHSAVQTLRELTEFEKQYGASKGWTTLCQIEHGKDYELQEWLSENAEHVKFRSLEWPKDSENADTHQVSRVAPLLLTDVEGDECGEARAMLNVVWNVIPRGVQKRIVWWRW